MIARLSLVVARAACFVFGHGPWVHGWMGAKEGRFCQLCERFWEGR